MENESIGDVLALQSERLAAGHFDEISYYLQMCPSYADELEPLLLLAQAVAKLLQEPQPQLAPTWRAHLKQDLLAEHHQLQWRWLSRRAWAAVGVGGAAVAVAGLLVYWRGRPSPPPLR